MPSSLLISEKAYKPIKSIPFAQRMGRRMVHTLLAKHIRGRLTLYEGHRKYRFGQSPGREDLSAHITVLDPRFYQAAAFGGGIGVAESYMAGHWRCDDLVALMRLAINNSKLFSNLDGIWSAMANGMNNAIHWLRKNTLRGSRENIGAHYDLGNDFYRLFLDRTMAYSCGIFENETTALEAASIAKFERICRKLELNSDDHLLEIGTGWGGFAIYAAKHYGCRVTTTTISEEQYVLARQRIEAAGLDHLITLLKQDYRELTGTFDKLVSIEMIEAVGHHYLDTFLRACSDRLKADGIMLLQGITINDQSYDEHKGSVDFIKRYIFPGSCLISVTAMAAALTARTDMRIFHLEDLTPHYATTLNRWRHRFWDNIDAVRQLGFDERFIRMWHYYLCYCEAGFSERYIGNVQMLLTKPENRRPPLLPQWSAPAGVQTD